MRVTKKKAIETLIKNDIKDIANILDQWRSKNNTNHGWDGFFRNAYPNICKQLFPHFLNKGKK